MSSIQSASGKSEIADQYATQKAEKEKLRAEHEADLERLKKSYASEMDHTRDRFEKSLQNEKNQTYENLRDNKRKMTTEEKNLKRAGDERLSQKENAYRDEARRIDTEGTARLGDALKKQASLEEYQRSKANEAEMMSRQHHSQNARQIIGEYENKLEGLRQDKMDHLESKRAEHGTALEQINEHYDTRKKNSLIQQENEASNIQKTVDQQINESLLKNADRLEKHQLKNEDPFYRMSRVNSEFNDEGDYYQLKIKLPEHERKGLRVQISGQELQLSGTRSNNENAIVEPGHEVSTKSYQSFSERYQFDAPVDAKSMVLNEEDGWLVYSIPKYGPNHRMRSDRVSAGMTRKDLEMSRDADFKNSLPTPTLKKDPNSGTMT